MFDKIWSILLEEARWPFKFLFVAALLLLFFSVTGCSTAPMTEAQREERAYEQNERAAKWETCQRLYKALSVPTVSTHAHRRGFKHKDWEIKDDLWRNNCHQLLCQAQMWECGDR